MNKVRIVLLMFFALEGSFASVSGATKNAGTQLSGLVHLVAHQSDSVSGPLSGPLPGPTQQCDAGSGLFLVNSTSRIFECRSCDNGTISRNDRCVGSCERGEFINGTINACQDCPENFSPTADNNGCESEELHYQISPWIIDYFALVVMFIAGIGMMGSKLVGDKTSELRGRKVSRVLVAVYVLLNAIVLGTIIVECVSSVFKLYIPDFDVSNLQRILFLASMLSYFTNCALTGALSILDRKKSAANDKARMSELEKEMEKYRPNNALMEPTGLTVEDSAVNDEESLQSNVRDMRLIIENINLIMVHVITIFIVCVIALKKYRDIFTSSLALPRYLDVCVVFTLFWMLQFHVYGVVHELTVDDSRYKTGALIAMGLLFFLFTLATPWLVFSHAYQVEGKEPPSNSNNLTAASELFGFSSVGIAIGLSFVDKVMSHINDRQKELDDIKEVKRSLETTMASMNCCANCKPVEKRVVSGTSMTIMINTIRHALAKIPAEEVLCKWIPELSKRSVNVASLMTQKDSEAVNPESEMVESCKNIVKWNLELPVVRDCETTREAVSLLVSSINQYLVASKLKGTTRALASIIPSDLLMQLLIAAGYFSSFANVVAVASSLTMNPETIKQILITSAMVVSGLFLFGAIGISVAVRRLMNVYQLQQSSVHIIADSCETTDAACPRGHFQKSCSPAVICSDCPSGTWAPKLFNNKPVTKCFSCDDDSACPANRPKFDPSRAEKCRTSKGLTSPCSV